jgi:hypothetical protein
MDTLEVENLRVESALRATGPAGWLTAMQGSLHVRELPELSAVRLLADPIFGFDAAATAFCAQHLLSTG